MMAAGEARAVWQRTVNRYLVQEDAKRAPKFTSSHSSSSSSTKQPNQRAQVKTPMEAGLINMNWEQSLSRLKAFKS
uniref:Uncharacterized protein n=2 Tax=Brassica TaxID=3705 RepID=A0A3P6G5S8_BRAOL|nr:unnamed protein product [Brassica oleracea]